MATETVGSAVNKSGREAYERLGEYAAIRTNELCALLAPYTEITDRYGELMCGAVLALGQATPVSPRDAAMRDLIADVFDFLYESRCLILKGKLEIAYPLARRAYESLSLLVACSLDGKLCERWIAGKQVVNAEVRRILAAHPMGEDAGATGELYRFFSMTTHPNRTHMAARFLGNGNEFVLGAIGRPSLAMLADYARRSLSLWYWFAAFVVYTYGDILSRTDPEILTAYNEAAAAAKPVATWLVEQYNHVLAQEQAEMGKGV